MDHPRLQSLPPSTPTGKKIIVIVVDSLLEEPLQTLMAQNRLPAFSFLKENGWYTSRAISSFPTMSVSIESTMLTGSYPDKHQIPGLRWYDTRENRLVNYGDGFFPTLTSGVQQVMEDSLFHLNNTHLNKEVLTIHEELDQQGKSSASINALVYRGTHLQTLRIPAFKDVQTMAPPYFVLGTFHHSEKTNVGKQYLNSYGVNDDVSIHHLVQLIKENALPAFTMVYLPDMDHDGHKHGANLTDTVIQTDTRLQKILNSFGSWEKALQDHVFIVMGDSGVSTTIDDRQEAIIDLESLFGNWQITKPGNTASGDELALAVNGRMAYVYALQENIKLTDLTNLAVADPRFDTISQKNGEWIEVIQGGTNKQLRFRLGSTYADEFLQKWDIEGDWSVLDLRMDHNHQIQYGAYPDGLMQLYAAHHSHPGRFMILTTQPGFEVTGENSPTHVGGGNHGSFHMVDSYFPMFISGTEKKPKTWRIVDLKSFILDVLK
ncbi:alkaline phosphatase family protein [Ammoniphilus sp. 3BR4]|uniref:alkaline phosphatase family protein n=1 Tax=Ammoniphilus sp. 3BR4 TaxID=3158265 RepID=UPI00346633F4